MGLLARLTKDPRRPAQSRIFQPLRTIAGVKMTADEMMRVSTVWAATRYLSQTPAMLPWHVMRDGDRGPEAQSTHPIDWILWKRASPEYSSFQFREQLIFWALRWGNGYAEIEPDKVGRPYWMHPIHPERVAVCRATEDSHDTYGDEIRAGELYYEIDNGMGAPKSQIKAKRIFHLRGMGEGPVGINVFEYAAESIGWARAAQLFGSAFFGNGMNPAGVVINKKPLKTPGALERQKEEFDNLYRGPARSHKTAFLDNDADWKPIGFNAREAQLIDVHQHLVEEQCRWFGAPPHKVQHLLRAHFTNIEHQNIEVVQDSVQPWTKRLEDEADYKLFGIQNRNAFYTKINLRGLMRGDFKGQNESLEIMRRNAVINADEWLQYLDMPRQPGGAGGDKYILQAQWTEQSKVGLIPEPTQPASPAEEPEEDDEPTEEDAEAMLSLIEEAEHA